jgi:hypothetical protein
MSTLFYLFGIMFIMYELFVFTVDTEKFHQFRMNFKGLEPGSTFTEIQLQYGLFHFGYMVWALCGIMTFQWPLFILYILYGQIRPEKIGMWYYKFNALFSAFIIGFIVVNHFHLRIDIFKEIIQPIF